MSNTCKKGLSFYLKFTIFICLILEVPCRNIENCCKYSYFYIVYDLTARGSKQCAIQRRKHERIHTWTFSKEQVLHENFPIDPIAQNYVREVRNSLFSVVYPIPFRTDIKLVSFSSSVLDDILDFLPSVTNTSLFLDFISGGYTLPGSTPLSHRYGGHQFGYWADQLGDGRAVMLGEYVNANGERWELQLKGSGLTPYSRRGDGRAVLRSSVREFLCSEAMFHLGIPTSRAATLIVSDDPVIRDQFYNGNFKRERGAVVLRLARSWFRIGSLEILTYNKEITLLKKLVDFIIKHHFHNIDNSGGNKYLELYSQIVSETAVLIAKWQSVGFTHGVGNTDNFSLLSITIDYGPFGFMDEYIPDLVPNTSDDEGRYSYEKQPDVGFYNLDKLRIAMLPLLTENQKHLMSKVLNGYIDIYKQNFMDIFCSKLGLLRKDSDDEMFVGTLLKMMEDTRSDFTMTFRQLGEIDLSVSDTDISDELWSLKLLSSHKWFERWIRIYKKRHMEDGISHTERQKIMNAINPRYILRNWMAQNAIEKAEQNDFTDVNKLLKILQNPFAVQSDAEEEGYASKPPDWAKKIKVSCSS